MKFLTLCITLAALGSAFSIPNVQNSTATSFFVLDAQNSTTTPAAIPFGKELPIASAANTIYSCSGSILCGSFPSLRELCDEAVNNLPTGITYNTNGGRSGNCWGDPLGLGCAVFVSGPRGCYRTADQIKTAYKNLRANGCGICGYVQNDDNQGDACQIKVDYVSKCG